MLSTQSVVYGCVYNAMELIIASPSLQWQMKRKYNTISLFGVIYSIWYIPLAVAKIVRKTAFDKPMSLFCHKFKDGCLYL